jgi:hypothetical protein
MIILGYVTCDLSKLRNSEDWAGGLEIACTWVHVIFYLNINILEF